MIRLDKYLAQMNIGTRSEVKNIIKKGRVTIDGCVCKDAERKIEESKEVVCVDNIEVLYEKFVYFMLNKPAGVVSATKDNIDKTVLDLLENETYKDIFPVGRLDKDTEGLLILTNDGELAHNLLSPKKHISKTYRVKTKEIVTQSQTERLEQGVDIGEEKPTLPAKVQILNEYEILLTIYEGKFHQVKRMLKAVGNEVVYLERVKMGELSLDTNLQRGSYRKLNPWEIELLKGEK